jgi:glucosylceramidase
LNPLTRIFSSHRALRKFFLCLLGVLLAGSVWGSAFGQEVKVYVSSKAGDRLTSKPVVRFEPLKPATVPSFLIETGDMLQPMVGFGASFLEAGMICLNDLPPAEREAVLRSLFDPDRGAGFSAMKTPIAGTDFMSAGPWYTYDDNPGDVEMQHFSIQRDLGPNGLIPYIKRARQYGKFVLQAPMDYPPDWMLFDVRKNQDVNPKYYDALAHYYLRYVQEYQKHGVFVDYVSLFNEPRVDVGGYTAIKYAEIRDLLKNHVGPLFKKEGVKNQIMLGEAPMRVQAYKYYPTVLDDPQARQYLRELPYHGYDYLLGHENFDKLADLHNAYPDLRLWMTEVCDMYEGGKPHSKALPNYAFEDGSYWGNMIFSDIEAGASAWIYWNMILDQQGGPWLVSVVHLDPENNAQQPVVIIDRKTKKVSYTGLYYYLAHFSKFVRPGAVRVVMDGKYPGLRGVAFLSPEREEGWHWVVELLNDRPAATPVQVDFELNTIHRSLPLTLPANSISTYVWKPLPNTLGNQPPP